MKNISCIREEKDQLKIFSYENALNEHATEFTSISRIVGLIGNEVRLKLIWLINEDSFCVCDLADILQMSVPAISQHLRKMRDVNIITSLKVKQTIYYQITQENKAIVNQILALVSNKIIV
jgi:DNA-binding transcriptional ArsR family regulator